jgi:N-acetylglucosamine-6-phosphate deacetylase
MRIRGKYYQNGELLDFCIEAGKIASIEKPGKSNPEIGGDSCWVAPGLIDIQINGYKGYDFCGEDLQISDVLNVSHLVTEAGVTAYCPTITTNSHETILANLKTIAKAVNSLSKTHAQILGVHLEGPYISPESGPLGAHPRIYTRKPNWDEFTLYQEASEGLIRLVTLAPELDGAIDFISKLTASGVVVALGHHQASGEVIRNAVEAGAVLSTHLGNGAHSILPRHPNYLWEQIAEDGLMASLILDGHHLPSSVVKIIYRVKGIEKIILISDVAFPAGLPEGRYQFMGLNVDVMRDGSICSTGTPYLAGSSLKLADALGMFIKYSGATFTEAVRAVTMNPAKLLGVENKIGSLKIGSKADITIFDDGPNYKLINTIIDGEFVFAAQ